MHPILSSSILSVESVLLECDQRSTLSSRWKKVYRKNLTKIGFEEGLQQIRLCPRQTAAAIAASGSGCLNPLNATKSLTARAVRGKVAFANGSVLRLNRQPNWKVTCKACQKRN